MNGRQYEKQQQTNERTDKQTDTPTSKQIAIAKNSQALQTIPKWNI